MSLDEDVTPLLRGLVSPRLLDRARVLAAAMRVAYILSCAMSGVLPRIKLRVEKGRLVLTLTGADADLASDKVASRLKQLGRLIGREHEIKIAG